MHDSNGIKPEELFDPLHEILQQKNLDLDLLGSNVSENRPLLQTRDEKLVP